MALPPLDAVLSSHRASRHMASPSFGHCASQSLGMAHRPWSKGFDMLDSSSLIDLSDFNELNGLNEFSNERL